MNYAGSILCVAMVFILGCAAAPEVRRTHVDEIIDLSGRWNDTDSRLVAEEMIKDGLSRPWLSRFKTKHGGRNPVVIVGTVLNRSHEHINTQVFIKNLERALINSGEVDFVASKDERRELREEKADMLKGFTSAETVKSISEETGADFMLQGSVNSVKDQIKGKYVILYQVNLELIHLETNKKVWIGEKQIKKFVKRPKYRF
ncbi:MAG: penicillin-binding protein activator LpoB [Deltaproteobacteria bacterium]|nr:penicillin-binding protein activator LpoB [Deltaproteobacteria bacterium]MBW2020809.1 penicillin-binding protein activator LpoB [Deltaproteobacteria bacterium]MBW2075412.1 penicillin-binding protein activator LpoB [Deltaproteobacteria bacterium]RLB80087.1 MAG: penicillin-binding protein activator LpoB [Deltaproteobacteria bacterium]